MICKVISDGFRCARISGGSHCAGASGGFRCAGDPGGTRRETENYRDARPFAVVERGDAVAAVLYPFDSRPALTPPRGLT